MLERENINNYIADDLALRNRNWGKIEGWEGAINDWQDGAVKLENMLPNSSEKSSSLNTEAGANIRYQANGGWALAVVGGEHSISVSGGHVYILVTKWAEGTNNNINALRAYGGQTTPQASYLGTTVSTGLTTQVVFTAPFTDVFFPYYRNSVTGSSYYHDTSLLINLTKTFGAGNEPTKEEMDELIRLIGWFDGEISLSQKQVAIWTLNMIRKNRNAIVALGGTIA